MCDGDEMEKSLNTILKGSLIKVCRNFHRLIPYYEKKSEKHKTATLLSDPSHSQLQ